MTIIYLTLQVKPLLDSYLNISGLSVQVIYQSKEEIDTGGFFLWLRDSHNNTRTAWYIVIAEIFSVICIIYIIFLLV